jgi:hypothetical protein
MKFEKHILEIRKLALWEDLKKVYETLHLMGMWRSYRRLWILVWILLKQITMAGLLWYV